ncbi:Uma2 family endonuclease [Stratiformator vulcanicus]|uniref:Putative restriction endonuclease domain-containing protein n=1 Tax=Stratiformator vulcanicus TaxID=2527980 RepID=A0A517R6V5_9PLAN|nr:Uma2 family endonuclease [Stratiformator vulcanicus]QDT39609.1 hypothetical protein Pan189_40180 [Stratiformator vulcanicus]
MPTLSAPPAPWTAADLLERFGPIPLYRIVTDPPPGEATEEDAKRFTDGAGDPCELVDGNLIRKCDMGWEESYLEMEIGRLLSNFVRENQLGIVLSPKGAYRLFAGRIRMPDASFIAWDKFPDRKPPIGRRVFALDVPPDLAVEVISPGNTNAEMDEKLVEYFGYGVRLVWYFYPAEKRVRAFTAIEVFKDYREGEELTGGDVLPGFSLSVKQFFEDPFPPDEHSAP